MLLCVQFPIADARRFLSQAERLGSPGWPLPTPDAEFVRFFGAIRRRPRGGLAGWIGEDSVCDADRALSFSRAPSFFEGHKSAQIVFRRFYFDGWAVGKYEIGLKIDLRSSRAEFKDLEEHLLRFPVQVRNNTGALIESELAQAGRHLARLYLAASTPTKKAIAEADHWQVRPGTPLLYLELLNRENVVIPKAAKSMSVPNLPPGIKLFHYGIPYRGGKIYMWILQHGVSPEEEDIARSLRLYLLRLNAEHECLRLILHSLAKKEIQITRGTPLSDDLQWYLDKAIKRITHVETKTGQVNEEIAQIARQSINVIRPGQLDLLLENVDDYRKHLRASIENFAIKDVQTVNIQYMEVHKMENTEGNTYNLSNFQAGILNIESSLSNVSQSVNSIPGIDQSTKDELKQLINQLNVALQKVPAEKIDQAQALSDMTKDLVEDISEEKPNKAKLPITLAGLKQAAENIAKILPDVLPIAIQISTLVAKSFGLG